MYILKFKILFILWYIYSSIYFQHLAVGNGIGYECHRLFLAAFLAFAPVVHPEAHQPQ